MLRELPDEELEDLSSPAMLEYSELVAGVPAPDALLSAQCSATTTLSFGPHEFLLLSITVDVGVLSNSFTRFLGPFPPQPVLFPLDRRGHDLHDLRLCLHDLRLDDLQFGLHDLQGSPRLESA